LSKPRKRSWSLCKWEHLQIFYPTIYIHWWIKHSFLLNFLHELLILYFVSSIRKCFCFSAVENSLLASNDANQFKFWYISDSTVLGQRAWPENEIGYTHCHWPIPHHVFGRFTPLFIFIISPPYFKFRIFLGRPSEYHRVHKLMSKMNINYCACDKLIIYTAFNIHHGARWKLKTFTCN
jgi:hypothetical protein